MSLDYTGNVEGPFRLLATSGPDCRNLVCPGPTDNAGHQTSNHLGFPAFWKTTYISFPLKGQSWVPNIPGFSCMHIYIKYLRLVIEGHERASDSLGLK